MKIRHFIIEVIERIGKTKDKLIPILQALQQEYNFLPKEGLEIICELTEITESQIIGVASFYSQFRHFPAGKHLIKVCVGTACHVKGALQVYDSFVRSLQLQSGEDTDKNGDFTLQAVSCLGCCTLAPVVQIDDVTYGKVKQNEVDEILKTFLNSESVKNQTVTSVEYEKLQGEIRLGLGSCCIASGSDDIRKEVIKTLNLTGINAKIKQVGCVGMCYQVPIIEIIKNGSPAKIYSKVKSEDVKSIIIKNFKTSSLFGKLKNTIRHQIEAYYYGEKDDSSQFCLLDLKDKTVSDFLNKQKHIATALKGTLSPLDIDEYIQNSGFSALKKALVMQKDNIVDIILASGLKGRGGGGFLTGQKWKSVANQISDEKYIICNGDEGDPGAFMDRMLLESFPYRIIEGLIIAAYAVGANKAFFYIRAEYPLAVTRIKTAIKNCIDKHFIGQNILNSGFNLDLVVFEGAGAFVCGEETALISSIMGSRGMPRIRPPYPSESGLFKKPTLVNNVETFSNIPWILNHGADNFASIGSTYGSGTKVFALAGKILRGGLIEVPMGITIREIVEEIGGGVQNGNKLKAVQIGGPSGGCIPSEFCNTPVDFKHLVEIGAMMGSGGLVVLDDTDCIVDIAKYFLSFTQNQSCGKCVFCRTGTKHLLTILEKITAGKAEMKDLDLLEDLCDKIKKGSLCGLGKSSPNPVLTTLKYFRDEYIAHIKGKCPSKKCKSLIRYSITDSCIGCTKCSQNCPANAIKFNPYHKHEIIQEKCIKCDICKQICPVSAVEIE